SGAPLGHNGAAGTNQDDARLEAGAKPARAAAAGSLPPPERSTVRVQTLVCAGALLAAPAAFALGGDTPLQGLVTAEREFAALSANQGAKAAFLAFLADDGVVFRPMATNGKKAWE